MEQQLAFALGGDERPLTKARISGLPAYRLTGVTDANRDLVKSTEMWVHYPRRGDEGWYLAVPDAWRDAAEAGLGRHGLGLETVERLPMRDSGVDRLFRRMLIWFGVGGALFAAAQVGGSLGGLIALGVPVVLLLVGIETGNAAPEYGEMVKPGAQEKREATRSKWGGEDTTSLCYVNVPGTSAWLMNPSLRNS